MKKMKKYAFTLLIVLSLLIGLGVNHSLVNANSKNLVVENARTSKDKLDLNDPLEWAQISADITNKGTETMYFEENLTLQWAWWIVHEDYYNDFIANRGNPTNNMPYWGLLGVGWLGPFPKGGFNWTVGLLIVATTIWRPWGESYLTTGRYRVSFDLGIIDDNPHDNSPFYSETMWPGLYFIMRYENGYLVWVPAGVGGVGGIVVPVDKFVLLAPYIGLASVSTIAVAATAVYVKCVKRRKERQ